MFAKLFILKRIFLVTCTLLIPINVSLCVCASLQCMSVCLCRLLFLNHNSLELEFMQVHLDHILVMFEYRGHWIKVRVKWIKHHSFPSLDLCVLVNACFPLKILKGQGHPSMFSVQNQNVASWCGVKMFEEHVPKMSFASFCVVFVEFPRNSLNPVCSQNPLRRKLRTGAGTRIDEPQDHSVTWLNLLVLNPVMSQPVQVGYITCLNLLVQNHVMSPPVQVGSVTCLNLLVLNPLLSPPVQVGSVICLNLLVLNPLLSPPVQVGSVTCLNLLVLNPLLSPPVQVDSVTCLSLLVQNPVVSQPVQVGSITCFSLLISSRRGLEGTNNPWSNLAQMMVIIGTGAHCLSLR